MNLGNKIKRVRTFRGMTQRELGMKLGYKEHSADVRVAQYESGYRVPKNSTLVQMAEILNINPIHFMGVDSGCAEDLILMFIWFDEDNRNTFQLFQLSPDQCGISYDSVGIWIDYDSVNNFMHEWCMKKIQLKTMQISEDEYFEWKINYLKMAE